MIKLIKNELIKIFHKKTIYVMFVVMLAFVILNNIIIKVSSKNEGRDFYTTDYIDMLESELSNMDNKELTNIDEYISKKTELDTAKLVNKYGGNSWQAKIIENDLQSYIYDLNAYEYNPTNKEYSSKRDALIKEYQELLNHLELDDWKFFANKQLEDAKKTLATLEASKELQNSKNIDTEIDRVNAEIYIINKRLENNIPYGNDYLNNALSEYKISYNNLLDINNDQDSAEYYDNSKNAEYEKKLKLNNLTENIALSKYVIETRQDINSMTNLRSTLLNFYDNYELLIIVLIVLVAGSIVSEEFNKGTIKLLLVRPYSRGKILLAKFLTVVLIILFALILLQIMQFIVGAILLGAQSLSIPAVVYNFNTNNIETMSIIKYMAINTMAKLPLYILVSTIAFFISTMFSNTSIGITIALLGYMSTSILNTLIGIAYSKNITFLKYFITMHWDLTQYLFGRLPMFEFVNLPFSVVMCIIYFLFMIVTTFVVFKRKEIKNI